MQTACLNLQLNLFFKIIFYSIMIMFINRIHNINTYFFPNIHSSWIYFIFTLLRLYLFFTTIMFRYSLIKTVCKNKLCLLNSLYKIYQFCYLVLGSISSRPQLVWDKGLVVVVVVYNIYQMILRYTHPLHVLKYQFTEHMPKYKLPVKRRHTKFSSSHSSLSYIAGECIK